MVILDGVSDRPINGKTPLSEANTPNLDELAKIGINGIMDPISPGVRPGSDTGHLALFGYDPFTCYPGRGPIEALGVGIKLDPGDVAFRINFATVKGEGTIFNKVVVDRRAGRIKETDDLIKSIIECVKLDIEYILARGTGHRGVLVLKGNFSDKVSDTDPKKVGEKVKKCVPLSKEAENTAKIVNDFLEKAHLVLEEHEYNLKREKMGLPKANAILTRGAGKYKKVERFDEKYKLKLAMISGTALVKGVARYIGGDVIEVKGATGSKDTNIKAKVKAAIKCLEKYDFVVMHIKATDEFGHDKDFEGKMKFIEKIDSEISDLLNLDFSKVCLIITADHSTPVKVGEHTADPVPVTICYSDVRVDDVQRFSDLEAYKGGLCRIRGMDLIRIALDLINKAEKFGA